MVTTIVRGSSWLGLLVIALAGGTEAGCKKDPTSSAAAADAAPTVPLDPAAAPDGMLGVWTNPALRGA